MAHISQRTRNEKTFASKVALARYWTEPSLNKVYNILFLYMALTWFVFFSGSMMKWRQCISFSAKRRARDSCQSFCQDIPSELWHFISSSCWEFLFYTIFIAQSRLYITVQNFIHRVRTRKQLESKENQVQFKMIICWKKAKKYKRL